MRAASLFSLLAAPMLGVVAALALCAPAKAEDEAMPRQNWSFAGPFGTFDRAAAQRGFQVYNEVCANCHSLKLGFYRDLAAIGLGEEQIKAIAAAKSVPALGDDGQPT